LVQVAVPSRGDVEEYQNLRTTVNELVGRINGQFGSIEFMPIHYMHQSVDFTELVALYNVSDVCLVSSTRDGMNLVWKTRSFMLMSGVVRVYLYSTTASRSHDS
jgi:trehalose 6-phosphate synthase